MADFESIRVAEALLKQGDTLRSQGRDAEAEPRYLRAIYLFENSSGNASVQLAEGLVRLADLFRFLNLDAEAVPLYQRALAIFERALGARHPRVADILLSLGDLHLEGDLHLDDPGGHQAAELYYQRALDIMEGNLGTDRPLADARPDLLAVLYELQGRYSDSASLHQWALTALKEELGSDHLRVAAQMLRFGQFCGRRGQFEEAPRLLQQALDIAEHALGPEHPGIRVYLRELADHCPIWDVEKMWDFRTFGSELTPKTEVARRKEALYLRALAIAEKSFGKDHPTVVKDLAALQDLYRSLKRTRESRTVRQRMLAIIDRVGTTRRLWSVEWLLHLRQLAPMELSADADVLLHKSLAFAEGGLGPDDPRLADAIFRFAQLCWQEGRYGEAETLFARMRAISGRAFGPKHPRMACVLLRVGLVCLGTSNAKAHHYYDEAVAILKRVPSISDSDIAEELLEYANAYEVVPGMAESFRLTGKQINAALPGPLKADPPAHPDIEAFVQILLPAFEKGVGSNHPLVGRCLLILGGLRVLEGEEAAAERLFLRALTIAEKAPDNSRGIEVSSLSGLAILYHVQKRYAEAEPLYRRWLARLEQHPDPQEISLYTPLFNLARCFAEQGRRHEIEPLFRRALTIAQARRASHGFNVDDDTLQQFYELLGRDADVEALARQDLRSAESVRGRDHPLVEPRLRRLAEICRRQGNYREAEQIYRNTLASCEQDLGPDGGGRLAPLLSGLGKVYLDQGMHVDAQPLLLRAISILEKLHTRSSEENGWLLRAMEDYISSLRRMEREDEAREFESRLAPIKIEVEAAHTRRNRQTVRSRGPLD